ncbi:hypothetical protein LTR56_007082 [Elasticomyces elasticus]|nr:hypothetical protein LTR56_007082 [Elasticomyces elasticus]KAK3664050.1 hypothetical protein LTR22_005013 [Elasticomyces elasticus]KAK4927619.1 hypothetical protein LTR49_005487 [Elasticomyces elasticus]KAK5766991.1 hypothetical protein LTS12_002755 [Elasticomyces elasticus]
MNPHPVCKGRHWTVLDHQCVVAQLTQQHEQVMKKLEEMDAKIQRVAGCKCGENGDMTSSTGLQAKPHRTALAFRTNNKPPMGHLLFKRLCGIELTQDEREYMILKKKQREEEARTYPERMRQMKEKQEADERARLMREGLVNMAKNVGNPRPSCKGFHGSQTDEHRCIVAQLDWQHKEVMQKLADLDAKNEPVSGGKTGGKNDSSSGTGQ